MYDDIPALREYVAAQKRSGKRVVLVPTMGALHDGHGACVEVGRTVVNATLVVSIFVNPTQFAPGEDLGRYPRSLDADLESCKTWGVDAVFTPGEGEMYETAQTTWVAVERLTEPMCGRSRPGHFKGVATVVAKLFNIVQPDVAVFGQKDAQQALVIREMVRQLNMPVELRLAETVRETDGLALSSRNAYLGPEGRPRAASISGALSLARERISSGERDPGAVVEAVTRHMLGAGVDEVEYAEIRNAADLEPLQRIAGKVLLAVAAKVNETRLIDNVVLNVGRDGTVVEELLF